MRVPSSPNQSVNPSTPWEAEPVVEESGAVEDANAENLYLIGMYLLLLLVLEKYVKCLLVCYLRYSVKDREISSTLSLSFC